jgi:hypothetical protein
MIAILLLCWKWLSSSTLKVWAWLATGDRAKWAVGAMTALLIAFLFYQLHAARSERDNAKDALEAANGEIALLDKARKADAAALGNNAEAKIVIAKKAKITSERTEAALSANPDWASQPVPADVIDSLR